MKKHNLHAWVYGKEYFHGTFTALIVSGNHSLLPVLFTLFRTRACIAGFLLVIAFACNSPSKEQKLAQDATEDMVYDTLWNEKAEIKYATGFTIDYFTNYKVVSVLSQAADADTLKYILVQRGTPKPSHYPEAQVIEIPIRTMVAMSSMHIALAEFLEATDLIAGVGSFKYVFSPEVRKRIEEGKVAEIGVDTAPNKELLISLNPDLVMAMASPNGLAKSYRILAEAGIPVMINTDWLETNPLGRAEWVKVMAALVNKEKMANERFKEIEDAYLKYTELAKSASEKPEVIAGMPYKGTWFVPDGNSYMGRLLKDATSQYHWSHTKEKGSIALDLETVYPIAMKADYWLIAGYENSLKEIAAKDIRYTDFKAFKQGTIYNNNKRVNTIGTNDFWESGVLNPHLILADLIHIFHPDLLPEHDLVYYKQLK